MSKELSRFERGARLELNDLKNIAETQMLEVLGQFVDRVIIGTDQADSLARGYILSGFTTDPAPSDGASAPVVTVATGVALLPYYHNGAVRYGFCLSAAPATRVIDLSGLGAGTYKIYIRPELIDDSFANRLSLDPLVSPVVERARNVPTRKIESWSLTASTTSPGADWTEIASVVLSGGTATVTDTRELFFEGKSSAIDVWPLVPTTEWGTSNDRLANRGTYGVFGFRKFARAVQQQLETLQGDGKKWFEAPTKTMDQKLNRDGTNTIQGTLLPSASATHDIGASGTMMRYLYAQHVYSNTGYTYLSAVGGSRQIPLSAIGGSGASFAVGVMVTTLSADNFFSIPLPNDATLGLVEIYVSNIVNVASTTTFDVVRVDDAGTIVSCSSGGAVNITTTGQKTFTCNQNHVHDTGLYAYYLRVVTASGVTSTVSLTQARVTYTVSYVNP